MHFYKKTDENGNLTLIETSEVLTDESLIEITYEEMVQLEEELIKELERKSQEQQVEEVDYIAQLERENAELLFNLLTGESFNVV